MTLSSAVHQFGRRAAYFLWTSRKTALAGLLCAATCTAVAQQAPSVVEVKAGDTFSSIAAQFAGGPLAWRKLYRPNLTGLNDPNRILVGMRFEVIADPNGKQYLRLLGGGHGIAPAGDVLPSPTATAVRPTTTPAPLPARAAAASAPIAPAPSDALVIGVLPNISPSILITNYQRMVRYLERDNAQKVSLVVPRTFKEFFDSMIKGEYDLAIAAPHFARVAQLDRGLVPLLVYQPQINGLFVAPIESTVKGPRDLRERVVAFANPTSLVAMYGQQWFKQSGIEATDYEARAARTDLGVGRTMLSGDAVAAIMSNGEFRSIPPDELSRLKSRSSPKFRTSF